jgi:hypothetical protein
MPDLMRWPTPPLLRRLTGIALLGTLAIFIYFRIHDRPLSPYTIVSYEFAWTPERAARMFAVWGEAGMRAARESLWIDFLFMPAYALLFAGLALAEARAARAAWARRVGKWPVALPFGAWLLDAIENVALLQVLSSSGAGGQPAALPLAVAGTAAALKFGLLALCTVYIVGAWLARLRPS